MDMIDAFQTPKQKLGENEMKTFPTVVIMLTLLSTSLDLPGKIDPRRVRTMQKYSYSNWCGHTRMAYPRLVQDWYLPDLSLPTNGINAVVENEAFETGRGFFIVRNGDELFYIDSKICGSVEDAHASVIERFSNMTTTRIFPQVTNDIGDVLFHYRFNSGLDFAVFTRNNVFVWIDSRIESCSATNIAKQVDASILRASGVEP